MTAWPYQLLILSLMGALPNANPRLWPFDTDAERLVQQAHLSRQRLDFAVASALLDEASGKDSQIEPAVNQERGLVARDRGDLERALSFLKRAADADPTLAARVDQAGVLVQMGRWPEAVTVIRQAFDERGAGLPVDQIVADKRFVKLATLKPYLDIIDAARNEQAGPFGRVLVRLERLQVSASAAEHGLGRLAAWLGLFRDIIAEPIFGVVLIVFAGVFLSVGLGQFGVFVAPWNLLVGMLGACLLWAVAARSLTDGQSLGRDTILTVLGGMAALWAVGAAIQWLVLRLRQARRGAGDPFAGAHLPDTLVLVDEVSRLGHRIASSRRREQRVLLEALRQAGETLRERLDKGA